MIRTLRAALAGMCLVMLVPSAVLAAPTLEIGAAVGGPGDVVELPIRFHNDGRVVGLQLELVYDDAYFTQQPARTGADAGGATLSAGPPTVVIADLRLSSLSDGELALVPFRIDPATPPGRYRIAPVDLLLSDSAAGAVQTSAPPGAGTIRVEGKHSRRAGSRSR